MFSLTTAIDRLNLVVLQLSIFSNVSLKKFSMILLPRQLLLILVPLFPLAPQVTCADTFVKALVDGINQFLTVLVAIAVGVSILGIVVGGLMRATSFGNERRIAMSNTAITCAVIGLVIVLLAATLGKQIPVWVGATGTCPPGGNNTTPANP